MLQLYLLWLLFFPYQVDHKKVNLETARETFGSQDWIHLQTLSADDAATWLTSVVLSRPASCIPQRWIVDKAFVHHWINENRKRVLARTHAALGIAEFEQQRDVCSLAFLSAYQSYVAQTLQQIEEHVSVFARMVAPE